MAANAFASDPSDPHTGGGFTLVPDVTNCAGSAKTGGGFKLLNSVCEPLINTYQSSSHPGI